MDETTLFVYGSLRRGVQGLPPNSADFTKDFHQATRFMSAARTPGRLYRVDWYPALLAPAGPNDWVLGDLLAVPDSADFWDLLDGYEEAGPAPEALPDPLYLYRRVILPIRMDGEQSTAAWGYLYNHAVDEGQRIPNGDWLR